MSLPLIKYPFDPTGSNPNNLVTGESQSLAAATNRAFVPNNGPFFTRGLVVRSMPSGTVLTPETQYKACQLYVDATLRVGEEICSVIVITDSTLGSDFSIDYQVVGGEFSESTYAVQQMINALQIDDRAVNWGDILGKPEEFAPTPHLHDLGDLYGFEYITVALEQLRQAILTGDDASHAAIYQYVDHQDGLIWAALNPAIATLNAHLADHTNPHATTAAQVGLGLVQNFGVATLADAIAGTRNDEYMTPYLVAQAVNGQFGASFNAHITNYNNPHQTTAAQVNLGNVANYGIATTAQAQAGTLDTVYMTALKTSQAITTLALGPLQAHINDTTNPHHTTAAQVGLGNVQNYGIASTAGAQAGTDTASYMTPALTAAAVSQQALVPLNAHIARTDNPHATTKAQVGLGSVDNTADVNKPVSTPQQNALNLKASLNAAVGFSSVSVGADGDIVLYEYTTNGLGLRTGSNGAYYYATISPTGDLTVGGAMVAGRGFQPSDRRLKKNIRRVDARALWRDIKFKEWDWKSDGRHERGMIAQDVEAIAPDYVEEREFNKRKNVKVVDKLGMAYEMATAAGLEVDELRKLVVAQGAQLNVLSKQVRALSMKG